MNVQSCFPRVTNEEPFEGHLSSTTLLSHRDLPLSRCPVCQKIWRKTLSLCLSWYVYLHFCLSLYIYILYIYIFLMSRWLKRGATWLFHHVTPLASALALNDTEGNINGTIAFLRSRWLKWDAGWLVWSCDAIGIGITWHQRQCGTNESLRLRWLNWGAMWHFHHMTRLASASYASDSIVHGAIEFLRSRQSKWGAIWLLCQECYWYWHHMMQTALLIVPPI